MTGIISYISGKNKFTDRSTYDQVKNSAELPVSSYPILSEKGQELLAKAEILNKIGKNGVKLSKIQNGLKTLLMLKQYKLVRFHGRTNT